MGKRIKHRDAIAATEGNVTQAETTEESQAETESLETDRTGQPSVHESVMPLVQKLAREAQRGAETEREACLIFDALPAATSVLGRPTAAEAELLRASHEAVVRRTRPNASPPDVRPFSPLAGGDWQLLGPPYDLTFFGEGRGCSLSFRGTWTTSSSGFGHSECGLGTMFVPIPRHLVRFAPLVSTNWEYELWALISLLGATPSVASSSGFVGTYVSVWDGLRWVEVADVRRSIWDRRVSANDMVTESGQLYTYAPEAIFQTADVRQTFALWAWGGVTTFERVLDTHSWASARAKASAHVPFMFVEQLGLRT